MKGKRTLHPMLCTISTPQRAGHRAGAAAPGKAADVRGAQSFVAEAISMARQCGATGGVLVRADSKFYTAEVVAACRGAGAWFSLSTGIGARGSASRGGVP